MHKAELAWDANKRSEMSLIQRFDYFGLLSAQFPRAPLRVVYSKAGTLPAARIPEGVKFQRARALVRAALAEAGLSQRIDALVVRLLDSR